MNLTIDGESRYVETGTPDTYTPLSDGPHGSDGVAANVNGPADAVTKLQALLGNALVLKGTTQDLVARLSRVIGQDGALVKGTSFPVTPAPIDGQPFYRTDLNQVYIFDAGSGQWRIGFDNDLYALLDATRFFTGDVSIKKLNPAVRLIGTEANAKDYLVRESGGRLSTYVNTGTELVPVWTEDSFFFDTGDFCESAADSKPGWLLCDGSEFNRVTDARLFAKIGTKFGPGNGTTTANLPNRCGRGTVGAGTGIGGGASGVQGSKPAGGAALTARAVGDWFGEETHVLTVDEIPSHTHPNTAAGDTTGAGSTLDGPNYDGTPQNNYNTGPTGGDQAHNNLDPKLVVNVFIKR